MRTKSLIAIAAASLLALGACSSDAKDDKTTEAGTEVVKLVVGASPVPHADILKFVDDNLAAAAGIDLEIKEYTDYVQPNVALDAGELDANFFQHVPYFDDQVATKGYKFSHGEGVHIEPFGIYSKKVTDLKDIAEGGVIVVTNDASNQARGLKLLEDAGLITLTDAEVPSLFDVKDNPKNLQIKESDAAAIAIQLPDVDAAVINGNFALEAGLIPSKDALQLESGEDNPYGNVLAWETDGKNVDAVKKLDELLHSKEVADFITEKYPNGEVIPAFTN